MDPKDRLDLMEDELGTEGAMAALDAEFDDMFPEED